MPRLAFGMEHWITSIMDGLGHWGVALLMFLENVFPPIPSELIMPLAGFAAEQSKLSFGGVVLAGTVGSVLGQFPLYYLGRALGRKRIHAFADRYGKWIAVSGADVDRAGDWLRRRGVWAIFFCRLIPGVRSLISLPAGASRMNLLVFTLFSTLGICIWSVFLTSTGYFLGQNYHLVKEYMGPAGNIIWVVIGIALVAWILWRLRGCFLHASVECPFRDEPVQETSKGAA